MFDLREIFKNIMWNIILASHMIDIIKLVIDSTYMKEAQILFTAARHW